MQRNYQKQNKEMKKKPFRLLNYIWSDNDQILFPCVYIYIYIYNKQKGNYLVCTSALSILKPVLKISNFPAQRRQEMRKNKRYCAENSIFSKNTSSTNKPQEVQNSGYILSSAETQ